MENDKKDLKEIFGIEENLDEGFMDWLLGRWRNKLGDISSSVSYLEKLYSMTSSMKEDFPTHVNRIRSNIKRVIMDLEDIDELVRRGKNEKNRFQDMK